DVETMSARRPVDGGDVGDVPELATRIVTQEGDEAHDVGGVGQNGELAERDGEILHHAVACADDRSAEFVKPLVHGASFNRPQRAARPSWYVNGAPRRRPRPHSSSPPPPSTSALLPDRHP